MGIETPEPKGENISPGREAPAREQKTAERPAVESEIDIRTVSIASENHPDRNEDAMFWKKENKIFGVLDGLGGHAAGEVASGFARDYIMESLEKLPATLSLEETQEAMRRVLEEANTKVLEQSKANPEWQGMGTTASIVKIVEDPKAGRKAVIGQVGDSRVYILRSDGELEQITLDDNIVSSLAKDEKEAWVLQEKLNNTVDPETLTPAEQMMFRRRNEISQALGTPGIKPKLYTADIHDGDRIIVTSDGIHDNLTDEEIREIARTAENSEKAAESLAEGASKRSRDKEHPRAKADDMSAIVVEFPRREEVRPEAPQPEVKEKKRSLIAEALERYERTKEPGAKPGRAQEAVETGPAAEVGEPERSSWKEKVSEVFGWGKGVGMRESLRETSKEIGNIANRWGEKLKEGFGVVREKAGEIKIKTSEIAKSLDKKKIFGSKAATFLAGAATGTAVRLTVRTALGGGTGILIGAASGAISGAALEGVKTYRRERRRLFENPVSKDELLEKAKEIGEGKENLHAKLERYLDIADKADESSLGEEYYGKEKKSLYRELQKELSLGSIRWQEVRRGILKGAIIGGVGGALGGALGNWLSSYFEHTPQAEVPRAREVLKEVKEEVREAVKETKAAGSHITEAALKTKVESASYDAYAKTYEKTIAAGIEGLDQKTFNVSAEKGEGLTHVSRKLIHEYIAEQRALGQELSLDKSQLVYAEDAMRRSLEEDPVMVGEVFEAKGESIKAFIEKAQGLGKEQLENLEENWVPKVSEESWREVTDYSAPAVKANDFSSEILKSAEESAALAAKSAAEEAAKEFAQSVVTETGVRPEAALPSQAAAVPEVLKPEKIPEKIPEISKAKDAWLQEQMRKDAIGAAWGGLAGAGLFLGTVGGFYAYRHREALGARASRLKESISKRTRALQELIPSPLASLEKRRERRAEEKKKIEVDPIRKHLAAEGIRLKRQDLQYGTPRAEDIGKEEARSLHFTNYSDFREYYEALTPKERRLAERYRDFGVRILSLRGSRKRLESFRQKEEGEWKKGRALAELMKSANHALLADEYGGLAERQEITFGDILKFREKLEEKFQVWVGSGDYAASHIGYEEEYEGIKKLEQALTGFPAESLKPAKLSIGETRIESSDLLGVRIFLDSELSVEEMQKFLSEAAGHPEVVKLREKERSKSSAKVIPFPRGKK